MKVFINELYILYSCPCSPLLLISLTNIYIVFTIAKHSSKGFTNLNSTLKTASQIRCYYYPNIQVSTLRYTASKQ